MISKFDSKMLIIIDSSSEAQCTCSLQLPMELQVLQPVDVWKQPPQEHEGQRLGLGRGTCVCL